MKSETENNHKTKHEAGRTKIPVNFIVIFLFCLVLFGYIKQNKNGTHETPTFNYDEMLKTSKVINGPPWTVKSGERYWLIFYDGFGVEYSPSTEMSISVSTPKLVEVRHVYR